MMLALEPTRSGEQWAVRGRTLAIVGADQGEETGMSVAGARNHAIRCLTDACLEASVAYAKVGHRRHSQHPVGKSRPGDA